MSLYFLFVLLSWKTDVPGFNSGGAGPVFHDSLLFVNKKLIQYKWILVPFYVTDYNVYVYLSR